MARLLAVLSAKLDASGCYFRSWCAVLGGPVLHLPPPCRCLRFPVASQATWEVSVEAIESSFELRCWHLCANIPVLSWILHKAAVWQKTQPVFTRRLCCTSPHWCVVGEPSPTALHSACSSAFLSLHPFCSVGEFFLFCSVRGSCPWSSGPFCWSRWMGFVADHPRIASHTELIWSLVLFISMMLLNVVTFGRKWKCFSCSWQSSHCWYRNSMLWLFYQKCLGPYHTPPVPSLPPAALQELCWQHFLKMSTPSIPQKGNFPRQWKNHSRRICSGLVRRK